MRFGVYLCFAALIGLSAHAQVVAGPDTASEAKCIEDREAYFALDFWTFDQDPERGHRAIGAIPGCELVAADLISDYHDRLRTIGQPVTIEYNQQAVTISKTGEVSVLYWHEGQIRAFAGQTEQAIELFELSLKSKSEARRTGDEYALASIAFLQNDFPELLRQRTKLASRERRNDINLGVLDGLIACFGEPYAKAYGSIECNRRPG